MAGKDFRAAFSNMNQAVRPGNEQPVVKKQKMSLAEKSHKILWIKSFPREMGEKVESFSTEVFQKSLKESEKNA